MAIGEVASTGSGVDTTAIGRTRLAENFDTFLSLLTVQLKNQDPLSPMDSNQFTQQIVQMTGVEQQLQTNDLLKSLVANTTSGVATAVSLIGKEVRAESDVAALKDQRAEWTYTLDRDATDVKIEILDSNGRVVAANAPNDNTAGDHKFVWNGKSAAGPSAPDGTYTMRITARDGSGASVPTNIFADGLVTGVEQVDGTTLISIKGAQIPWDRIVSIRQPAATTTTANTAASTATGSNDNADDKTSSPAAA